MHRKLKIVNRKPKIENRSAGFTITEVVIASALLIVVIVPILKALTSAHASSRVIERKTRCLMLAQAKLDDIKARSIQNYGTPASFREMNTSLDGSYLCDVVDAAAGGPNLRKIAVGVGYDLNGNGILHPSEVEVVLATFIARRS